MDEKQSPRRFWDGTPTDPGTAFPAPRTMRVWGSSSSKMLRRDAQARCRFCWHRMEYFDRYDGGRIPLTPMDLPSARIPHRYHWYVERGVATRGVSASGRCRLPHPAICPMAEHSDGDRELDSARKALLVRTRRWIDTGSFIPAVPSSVSEATVSEQHLPASDGPRQIVRHVTALWLASTTVDNIRCVARVIDEDRQCKNRVLSDQADDGRWVQTEIAAAPGRAGQRAFWDGEGVWIWELDPLAVDVLQRWQSQRCTSHWPGTTPDAVPAEWAHLEPLWHSEHFTSLRPPNPRQLAGSASSLLNMVFDGPKRTICAISDCHNGSAAPVPDGWLCYRCERKARKRERTHRTYQKPDPGATSADSE